MNELCVGCDQLGRTLMNSTLDGMTMRDCCERDVNATRTIEKGA